MGQSSFGEVLLPLYFGFLRRLFSSYEISFNLILNGFGQTITLGQFRQVLVQSSHLGSYVQNMTILTKNMIHMLL
jgi:hypothetical protein